MKSLQIFKQLRVFSTRTMYACMMGASIFSLNGCNNPNDEQIIPKENLTLSLVEEYNLKEVGKPASNQKVVYLKDMARANQFFQNLKLKKEDLSNLRKQSFAARTNNATVLSHGFFTFINGQTATIHFSTQADGIEGEISSVSMNEEPLTFIQSGDYVQMFKWGIIAIPRNKGGSSGQDFGNFTEEYDYYYAPVAVYSATLVNNRWSSVQLLNVYEQANFDGEGTWETVYIPNPHLPGNDLPVTDPWFPQSVQGQ